MSIQQTRPEPIDSGDTDPADLLAHPPSNLANDDLEARIRPVVVSPRSQLLTRVLGLATVLAVGFCGGVYVNQHHGQQSAAAFPAGAFAAARAGGQGRAPAGGTAGAQSTASAATTGVIKLVDGPVVYVQKADGSVVRVQTDGKTTTMAATPSAVAALKTGDTVSVAGSTGTDGSVTATTITSEGTQ